MKDQEYTLATTLRVRYSETDQMKVVYNANYLAWFEVARTEYCRNMGSSYSSWERENILLPVVEAYCRYKKPALYDDVISLYCNVPITDLKPQSIRFNYLVKRKTSGEAEILLAEGWTKHAFIDAEGRIYRKDNPFFTWLKQKAEAQEA